jgi:hypothetical protein
MTVRSRIFACAALLAVIVGPASADIRAFNTAVQKGDYVAAVAAANETWPAISRANPDAASVAREFGWIAMLAGQPTTALTYAKFLVEQGASLARPDSSPVVSRILHDWASLASAPSQPSRTRLLASLQQRAAAPGQDLISVRAAHALYAQAWAAGDWAQAYDSALLAIRFLDEVGASQSPVRFELRRGVAASSYMRVKSPEAYNAIYDVAAVNLLSRSPRRRMAPSVNATLPSTSLRWRGATSCMMRWVRVRKTHPIAAAPSGKSIADHALSRARRYIRPCPAAASCSRATSRTPASPSSARFKNLGGEVIYALNVEAMASCSRILACWPPRPTPASRRLVSDVRHLLALAHRGKCVPAQLPHAAGPHPHRRFRPG